MCAGAWLALALLAAAPDASRAGQPKRASSSGAPSVKRLSNERTRTYVAYVVKSAWVLRKPRHRSKALTRLRTRTYYGVAERVPLLARTSDALGRTWYQIRYPGIGSRRGWVRATAVARPHLVRTQLVIDRRRQRIRLNRRGKLLLSVSVGIGTSGSPTPRGRYYIRERVRPGNGNGIYGALAFGTSAYSRHRTDWPGGGQVGIHGTDQPALIPGLISNGCVRLRNRDIRRLGRRLPLGTPLLIK